MSQRKAITPAQRFAVASRQGWKCTYQPRGKPVCGTDLKSQPYQVDHIHALVHSGENSMNNYRALCVPCHKLKTKQDVQDNAKIKRILNPKPSRHPMKNSGRKLQSKPFPKRVKK